MEKAQVTMERGLHTQLDPTFPEGGPNLLADPTPGGGPPKFPATFTTFPDGAAKSAKFPPNLAKVHVPRRLVTIRGILFHLQAPKVG